MRWTSMPERPRETERVRRWFAWYPRRADDGFTYWLTWLQVTEWLHPPTELVSDAWWVATSVSRI